MRRGGPQAIEMDPGGLPLFPFAKRRGHGLFIN
jgi:hypothetical protein